MQQHNELLTAARARIESPGTPGHPMTRQELAEAVNDHVFRATGTSGAVDARHVGRWERGVTRWPAARYRAALRAVLNVSTDAELGFQRHSRATVEDVDRKTFLKTTLGVGAGALLAPSDANLTEILSGPTAHYRQMESAVPSDRLSPAVDAHLNLAVGIVRDRLRTSDGYRMLSEVAGLAAWLAADRGDNAAARRRYAEAIGYAKRSHHPLLAAYMTASLGHFAVETGDGTQGLTLLQRASQQLDAQAPAAARAWLASLLAVAYASTGDREKTLAELRRADELVARQNDEPHWPWVFPFSAAKAARYRASAFGRLGDLRAARTAYAAAGPALTAAKPRALAQVEHARVLASTGDVAGGCSLATEALAVGRAYGSERITNRVREFRSTIASHTTEAGQLDDALAALYERDDG
jgi:tetratricopeptide (TPR) repeat protein